ncbi:MAG: CotH kinase family protein, partial [Clostridia bacterium]|nr:CotH kinase family protein [Clostridia bacterium]
MRSKRLLCALLALIFCLSSLLCACEKDGGDPTAPAVTQSPTEPSSDAPTDPPTQPSDPATDPVTDPATDPASQPAEPPRVVINEICAKNRGALLAPDGMDHDWIEIYNASDRPADIGGWMLSDSESNKSKFVFPAGCVIPSGGFLIVWAAGKGYITSAPGLYAPFKISSDGETVVLSDPAGLTRDLVAAPALSAGSAEIGWARTEDGGETFALCFVTPLATNEGSIYHLPTDLVSISARSGFYASAFDVTLDVPDGYALWYTTDCSDPTTSATAVEWAGERVRVTDPSDGPVHYAQINVCNASNSDIWCPDKIDQCFVLRVAAKDADGNATPVLTRCYFVGFDQKDGYEGLPIVCLTADPDGLYSKNGGLLVLNQGESAWGATVHDGKEWERQTNFTMISPDGEYLFDQEVGIKVRGTSTRGAVQKSLNVYARSAYDGNGAFVYPLFGDTRTRSLILRNDTAASHTFGQGYLQDLVADRDILTQRSMTVIVFLEGEYYGLYTLYERFCEKYVEDNYGVDEDNVWTAKKFAGSWGAEFDAPGCEPGDPGWMAAMTDLYDTLAYIGSHDMSDPACYAYVCERIDMTSLIDILCAQLYLGNVDFSLAQNVSAWRAIETDPSNPWADGRWRFVMYDLDFTLNCSGKGLTFTAASNPFTDQQPWAGGGFLDFQISTNYFVRTGPGTVKASGTRIKYNFATKMMQSEEFRRQFALTFQDLGNINFDPDRVKAEA